jgi:hypothetical protein
VILPKRVINVVETALEKASSDRLLNSARINLTQNALVDWRPSCKGNGMWTPHHSVKGAVGAFEAATE